MVKLVLGTYIMPEKRQMGDQCKMSLFLNIIQRNILIAYQNFYQHLFLPDACISLLHIKLEDKFLILSSLQSEENIKNQWLWFSFKCSSVQPTVTLLQPKRHMAVIWITLWNAICLDFISLITSPAVYGVVVQFPFVDTKICHIASSAE